MWVHKRKRERELRHKGRERIQIAVTMSVNRRVSWRKDQIFSQYTTQAYDKPTLPKQMNNWVLSNCARIGNLRHFC